MINMKIVQVSESLAIGDAVANDVVAINELLIEMGFKSSIFVSNSSNISKKYLHKIAEPISKLPALYEDDILLFHHAIANDFCYKIPEIKCTKVLIYHNITPPKFFEGIHEGFREATSRGLEQIKELNNNFDFCIADSEFNKNDLKLMGYKCPIYVCPVLIPFQEYKISPNIHIINKYTD